MCFYCFVGWFVLFMCVLLWCLLVMVVFVCIVMFRVDVDVCLCDVVSCGDVGVVCGVLVDGVDLEVCDG